MARIVARESRLNSWHVTCTSKKRFSFLLFYRFSFLSHYNLLSPFSSLFNGGTKHGNFWGSDSEKGESRERSSVLHSYALFLPFLYLKQLSRFSFFFLFQFFYCSDIKSAVVIRGNLKQKKAWKNEWAAEAIWILRKLRRHSERNNGKSFCNIML